MFRREKGNELASASSAEYDLVLNQYVFFEKVNHAAKGSLRNRESPVGKYLLIAAVALSIITVFWYDLFWSALAAVFMVSPLFVVCCMLSVQRRGFPTNLCLNDEGIVFKWCMYKHESSPVFRWEQILSATIFQLPRLKEQEREEGKFLRLMLETSSLYAHQHWWLWTFGAKLKHNAGLPFEHTQCYFDRVVFEIPLDAFTRDSDKLLLADIVTKKLGVEKVGDSLRLETGGTASFTRLWLDEAQSFRRKNIETLSVDDALQDGRYLVAERIASGGQATVYRALDTWQEPPRIVVLKELVLPVSAGNEVRKRSFESVKNEALLLSGLKHPGIVELYDNFVQDHRAYLVLEYVEGTTLRDTVQLGGGLSEEKVVPIVIKLCQILSYLHGKSPPVVHRDFTPDNLMLTREGDVKLLDFNVALQSESTSTKTVVGKHNYIAPEQFRGKPCTQSDLYSLGATIYYLRTASDPVALKTSKLSEAGLPPSPLDEIVGKLTATDLKDRYACVEELKTALTRATTSTKQI